MKILKIVNTGVDGIVTFVLRVLGAFGACWGTFSSVSVTYREFFGDEKETDFMNNSAYAKTALAISTSAAILSTYVIVRDKLEEYRSKRRFEEIDVTIPICNTFNLLSNRRQSSSQEIDLEPPTDDPEDKEPFKVICKKKNN